LGVRSITEDIIVPITPNQLLIGKTRGNVTCPDALPEEYTKQKTYSDILLQSWWSAWYPQVFDNLIPYQSYRDAKRHSNLAVGDVCLLRYDSKVMATYSYCRVIKVEEKEGIVRNVVVKLGRRGKDAVCKEMKVGVHRLALVTPVENVEKELATFTNDDEDIDEQVSRKEVNDYESIGEDDAEVDEPESARVTNELKRLEVPGWMKPAGSKRSRLNSVINLSTLQGLKLGVTVY
jgi:hypothetical protein